MKFSEGPLWWQCLCKGNTDTHPSLPSMPVPLVGDINICSRCEVQLNKICPHKAIGLDRLPSEDRKTMYLYQNLYSSNWTQLLYHQPGRKLMWSLHKRKEINCVQRTSLFYCILTFICFKLFGCIFDSTIRKHLSKHLALYKDQYGFQHGSSCKNQYIW